MDQINNKDLRQSPTDDIKQTENQKIRNPRLLLASLQQKIAGSPSSYLAYCFIVPVCLMFFVYLAMELHPFGDGCVLVLDLNGQYVYFFEGLRNAVYGEGSILYTFFRGLGGEFMGMYAYYLASPLSYIVALFPQDRILEALLTIILLKVGLCGWSFGYYLHKNTRHPNKIVTVAFSVMYALCAYAVVYQNNIMWIDALIWLPLLTYGIEQMIKYRKYKLYVISLALTIMSNYYIGYMVCIYSVLYFFYYFLARSKEEINPNGYRLHFLRSGLRFAFFSIVAAAISAFVILGAYYSLSFGKSDFSDPNWSFRQKFDILDFFTKFLPGSYDTVRPEGLPFVYCGVLTLLLLPVYFMAKKIEIREKLASIGLITVFILSFIASPLDLIWHGFQNPNWLNHRYSFMLCFILLVLAYKGFGNMRKISEKFLLGIAAFIVLFVAICDKLEFKSYVESKGQLLTLETVWLTVIATVVLLVLLCLLIRQKHPKKRENLSAVLACVVCVEIFCSSLGCVVQFDGDVAYSTYSSYNNFVGNLRPVVEQVKDADDGFYRMEKLHHRKYNDNMALGIRGLSNSTSTLNAETIAFLNKMGYTARSHLSQYRGGTPVNDSLLGIKYLIDQSNSEKLTHLYEEFITTEKYNVYYNENALSIAYGTDELIKKFDMTRYNTYFDRLNNLVGQMLGDKKYPDIFVPVSDYERELSSSCTMSPSVGGQVKYSQIVEGSNSASVTFTIVAPSTAQYYFYTPYAKAAETDLAVNGASLGRYLGNDTKHIISLGWFEQGEEISVKITLRDEKPITLYTYYDYFWYIDEQVFDQAFSELKSNPQFVIEEYTEDHLIGSIDTKKENQMIQTTIPYDEGWRVILDGEEVEIYKTLDALIAFDIPSAGEHTLELKYSPKIYTVGAILSVTGTLVFAVICLIDFLVTLILKKRNHPLRCEPDVLWTLEDFDEDHDQLLSCPPVIKKKKRLFKKEHPDRIIPETQKEQTEENTSNTNEDDQENH